MGSPKIKKIGPGLNFRGLGRGPKNGAPSRTPKSEILMLFTTLELGPTSQKGTPFWFHFGDLFGQKNEKSRFQKELKNQLQQTLKMVSKQAGLCFGILFHLWTLLGPTLLLERSWTSIFVHVGFVLSPKSMFWGPWIRLFRELFVVVSGCFFRQSTWRCSNSPRKESREFPPV